MNSNSATTLLFTTIIMSDSIILIRLIIPASETYSATSYDFTATFDTTRYSTMFEITIISDADSFGLYH